MHVSGQSVSASDFNPRSPYGERPLNFAFKAITNHISIHAPRMGSDFLFAHLLRKTKQFQSTLPVWGATPYFLNITFVHLTFQSTLPVWGATWLSPVLKKSSKISIHAPRMGSDYP